MKRLLLPLLLLALSGLLPGAALASRNDPHVTVIGLIGQKAILRIEGQQHMLGVGDSADGVTVVSVSREDAVLRINGQNKRLGMGMDTGAIGARVGGGSVEIAMNRVGQFITNGQINGRVVEFLVDTGANTVSMTAEDARVLGIDYKLNGQRGMSTTAAGPVEAWSVTLASVKIGPIEVKNVQATIRETPRMTPILLGMTFLARVNLQQEQNRMRLSAR
ncbi:MAG: TIGR02281 family clan AA aspartic protease [Moraxellaceae bacterium]|nr:TIGR02281 family clan AA aspartic protease [Moraxellaceae bacterium]